MASSCTAFVSEVCGTFVMIAFGVGSVAQAVLSEKKAGNELSINLAWGLGVTMGVFVAAAGSGAHLNPVVTLSLVVHGKCGVIRGLQLGT